MFLKKKMTREEESVLPQLIDCCFKVVLLVCIFSGQYSLLQAVWVHCIARSSGLARLPSTARCMSIWLFLLWRIKNSKLQNNAIRKKFKHLNTSSTFLLILPKHGRLKEDRRLSAAEISSHPAGQGCQL